MIYNKKLIYKKAFRKYGEDMQIIMLSEEVGELLQVISKYRRGKISNLSLIGEEIADVRIMLEEIECMLGITNGSYWFNKKLGMLKEIVEKNDN